jgi:Uma2 family endonuclease
LLAEVREEEKSMSVAIQAPPVQETVADLIAALGDIPASRIRLHPPIGSATEADVLELHTHTKRLCELVDGILVEKPMGYEESRLALIIGHLLLEYLSRNNLGVAAGEAGMLRIAPGLVRIPDVSFILWENLPENPGAIPPIAPDLAVEVLSESNTPKEMQRKLNEYFAAGSKRVWFIDPRARTATDYSAPDRFTILDDSQSLDGGDLLPSLSISLRELFDWDANRPEPKKS